MRSDWSWEAPVPERGGIFIGWAPLASVLVHLLVIVLAFRLAGSLPRDPKSTEPEPLRVVLEPIPMLRVDPAFRAGRSGSAGGGRDRRARAAPAPGREGGPPAGSMAGAQSERAQETVSRPPEEDRSSSKPNPPAKSDAGPATGPLVADSRSAARSDPSSPSRTFSVERALRDFRRALRTAPSDADGAGGEGGPSGGGGGFGSPDLPPLPPTGFGFGNLQFESRDFDWTDYARQIYVAIWRAWHHRLYLTSDSFEKWGYQHATSILDHQSGVRFTIGRNGQLTGVAVESASGCIPLDDSATAALQEVVLPPLPPDFPRDSEAVHARFIANGEIRAMRPTLEYLRARGYF